ncbi:hypothetical protein ACH4VM_02800 [Streptomyces sp. NPDC020792]|uniref:hypothetical protein n=1 Tax=Streptomyces sp. NPDC020792 TaxID=3365089 RepID=UPI0037A7627B
MPADQPRVFHLQRDHDVSGVSGTGRVADGVQWPDGTVTLRWIGDRPSTVHWDRLDDALAIHGHGGATRIVWADEQPPTDQAAVLREAADELIPVQVPENYTGAWALAYSNAVQHTTERLRRMADEARP